MTLNNVIEAILLAAEKPMSVDQLVTLLAEDELKPSRDDVKSAIAEIQQRYQDGVMSLAEVASGYRFQIGSDYAPWVGLLQEERPQRYSRALLETLAIIAYRQPITRGDIEDIRGVAVSTQIMKTLQEREWVRVVGHKDVPGKPALFATTRQFLDYFNLRSLDQLPPLAEVRDLDEIGRSLELNLNLAGSDDAGEEEVASQGAVSPELPQDKTLH
ncbi:SMC-Scp complex subunit ScpB [Hahella sp. CCB-MM4]|uniref:SMC-Scp complex subunit ScpB n=1 Tax=Hahella sp. (strain CCB-MM4) TaxID=1926491 RepID=UPI000B9A886D|nr:SMC-Scp complex subunit ScpB [Hahella sp. CCB-MM4]OZG71244.1 SMC-Scp complex subunit ScpB [Hahella sp. CCB-MM4]